MGLDVDAGVAAGVETADLRDFCRGEHPRLVGFLTVYTGDRDLAQELAQDTIVRIILHWKKVSSQESPHLWARKIALNLANSWFRRNLAKRRAVQRMSARYSELHHDPDSATSVAIRKAISTLPVRQKTAIVLRYYADLPVGEVAEAMRVKEGTVRALTTQAIQSLRNTGQFELSEVADV